jgi:2-dehydropantoate 2-reductase
LVLQNGLNIEADVASIVGAERVLGGCCFLCSNKLGPGHIHHLDFGRIVFGEFQQQTGVSSRAKTICDDLLAAGIDAQVTADLRSERWRKLMWNIPFNGLSVALNATTKEIIDHPDAEALAEAIVGEVHQAGQACGAEVPTEMIEKTMESTRKMVPYDSSMRLDYLNRRPLEVEAIFGNPLRAAAEQGTVMPRVKMLYQQLKFLDARNASTADAT